MVNFKFRFGVLGGGERAGRECNGIREGYTTRFHNIGNILL